MKLFGFFGVDKFIHRHHLHRSRAGVSLVAGRRRGDLHEVPPVIWAGPVTLRPFPNLPRQSIRNPPSERIPEVFEGMSDSRTQ